MSYYFVNYVRMFVLLLAIREDGRRSRSAICSTLTYSVLYTIKSTMLILLRWGETSSQVQLGESYV